jgi:hypothetical protein
LGRKSVRNFSNAGQKVKLPMCSPRSEPTSSARPRGPLPGQSGTGRSRTPRAPRTQRRASGGSSEGLEDRVLE